tara:strand:- start:1387 stop:2259 length:873 start_codon:yes stop_codon:yes gene_type:complete
METFVLICSHNGEKFIVDQINSILNQDDDVTAIFVHDYNSSDNTRKILNKLSEKNQNLFLKYFDYAKSTCHSFLNSLSEIKNSLKGDSILYLCDQDDVWLNNKNSTVKNTFKENNIDFLFHDVRIVDENLKTIKNSYYTGYWDFSRDFNLPLQFYSNCAIGHTFSIKGSVLNKLDLKYDRRIIMHDWHITVQILINKNNFFFIKEKLSLYRQHSNNVLGESNKSFIKSFFRFFKLGSQILDYNFFLFEKKITKEINFSRLLLNSIRLSPIKKKTLILSMILAYIYKKNLT